jgi:hypothetical protein
VHCFGLCCDHYANSLLAVPPAAWQRVLTHFTMTTRAALRKEALTVGILKIPKLSLLRVFEKHI